MRFDDVIVVLPGIGGSVLSGPGGPLWDPSLHMAGALLRNRPQVVTRLMGDHSKLDDPDYDDDVVATSVISTAVTIPGLAVLNQYRPLRLALTRAFDLVRGDPLVDGTPANYFEFAYDWRRDNRVPAARLKALVDRELPKWNATLPYGTAKTVLICHSMGGLVAKYYLDVLGGWRHCRALITYGTPFRGSVNALSVLAEGITKFGVRFDTISAMLGSFTSVYQLLPRYPVMRKVEGDLLRVGELTEDVGGLDARRANQGLDFHRELGSRTGRPLLPVVGHGHRTAQTAYLTPGGLAVTHRQVTGNANRRAFDTGDGTVPSISALPVELSESGPWWWRNGKHSSLHTESDTLGNLVKRLSLFSANLEDLQAPDSGAEYVPSPPATALDVRLDEVQACGEPVVVDCVASDPAVSGAPEIGITPGAGVARVETGEGYRFTVTDLTVGAHEVTVSWAGRTVTDVFEVC